MEIQSEHFGNGRSLSMEGSTVEFHDKITELCTLHFHSHFADTSRQDAASTNAHMVELFEHLIDNDQMGGSNSVMWDDTDGCGKQYRCGKAFWLLSFLSHKYQRVIDRLIGAPGHGKGMVDGINGVDKSFLGGCMCLIGTPEANDSEKRMNAASMTENASSSLAQECARLCSTDNRMTGLKGDVKHAKRESNARVKRRHYHVQDDDAIKFKNTKYKAVNFPKDKGVMQCYNVRADPDLGLGKIAMRRIPCACTACREQLKSEWIPNIDEEKQPRYATAEDCKYDKVLHGFNDWTIADLLLTTKDEDGEV